LSGNNIILKGSPSAYDKNKVYSLTII